VSVGLGIPNNVVPVPVVPPPTREVVMKAPVAGGGGFEVFPKMLPEVAGNGEGLGVDGFAPKLNGPIPGAGPVEVVPPPNRPPPVVVAVVVVVPGVVEVVPKSEPIGLVPKMLPGIVAVGPVPVVPVPVVPVPVPGVVFCVVPV